MFMKSDNTGKFYNQAATTEYFTDLAEAMNQFKTDAMHHGLTQEDIAGTNSYMGESADATKNLVKDFEETLLAEIIELQDEMISLQSQIQQKFAAEVDSAPDANLEYDVLEEIKKDFLKLKLEFDLNCIGVEALAVRCNKYRKYYPFSGVDFSEAKTAFDEFCGGIGEDGYLDECQKKLIKFDEEVCQMIKDSGLSEKIDYINLKLQAATFIENPVDTISVKLQEGSKKFLSGLEAVAAQIEANKAEEEEKEDDLIEFSDVKDAKTALLFAAQTIKDEMQFKEDMTEMWSSSVEDCKLSAIKSWESGTDQLQDELKKKGIDIPHYDKLVEGGTMALEGLAMVVDVPNRDEQFDKLEDSCREALRALVDIKPDAFYSLAFLQAPTIVKQLMYVPEIGEQIASGNGLDFDKIEENAKENYKNLLIGGQYCFTDMLASVVKLPRICSHLNKIRQKRIETQIDDFLQSQGSLEELAQIKVDRLKSGFSGIGNTITDATTDFINQDKDEKYQTAGYAVTFLAMLADSAFSIMDAVKASKATKAVESVETVVESGEEIAEVAGEGTEVLAEGEAAVEGGLNSVDDIINAVEKGEMRLSNNIQKGNYGEMKMDAYFENQGYERISLDRVTDLNAPSHQGIDGVYYNPDGHPPYIIGEAKYGSARLGNTLDGPQMSDDWIYGSNRLANAVDKATYDDILIEGYKKRLVNIDTSGAVNVTNLD